MNLVLLFLTFYLFHNCLSERARFPTLEECKLPTRNQKTELRFECPGGASTLWPWMGRLLFGRKSSTIAFGFLITNKHLITRCVYAEKKPESVILGETMTTGRSRANGRSHTIDYYEITKVPPPKPLILGVKKWITHKSYEQTPQWYDRNDIAIIELETTVEFDDYIKPLCLPIDRDSILSFGNDYTDYIAFTAGWNKEDISPEIPYKFYESELMILEDEKCVAPRKEMMNVESIFCATAIPTKGALVDDRGFPVVVDLNGNAFAIGLMMRTRDPVIYKSEKVLMTKLTDFASWIKETTGITEKPKSSNTISK